MTVIAILWPFMLCGFILVQSIGAFQAEQSGFARWLDDSFPASSRQGLLSVNV